MSEVLTFFYKDRIEEHQGNVSQSGEDHFATFCCTYFECTSATWQALEGPQRCKNRLLRTTDVAQLGFGLEGV